MSVVALVIADGRLGDGPMCLVPVAGIPLVVHAVNAMRTAGVVDRVAVAVPSSEADDVVAAFSDCGLLPDTEVRIVRAGSRRVDSVRHAFAVLAEEPGSDITVALVHDAARAFAPPELIRSVVAEVLAGATVVVPVLPCTDTVKRVAATGEVAGGLDRSGLRVAQTPIGYQIDRSQPTSSAIHDGTYDGSPPVGARTVAGHPDAREIATDVDLAMAEAALVTANAQESL